MNNDTTTHNTTRHYYMGGYSLGHHVWVAGEYYLDVAGKLADAGSMELAGQMLRQAEESYAWANALQSGTFLEVGEDMVGVRIDTLDAWMPTERVAILNARVRGETLPPSPSREHVELGSPENVSRETSSCTVQVNAAPTPYPMETPPSAYDGVMDTTTTTATAISDIVAQLITLISSQVLSQVTSEIESICEGIIENGDFITSAEEVTESYDFSSAVESIISDYDFSDKVRDTLGDVTFTVSID
jgi:hypothetical protein